MKEITPEQREAYRWLINAQGYLLEDQLRAAANGWRDTTAALMQSEFGQEHLIIGENGWCSMCKCYLELPARVQFGESVDPRHLFKESDWQAAAEKYCRGEG